MEPAWHCGIWREIDINRLAGSERWTRPHVPISGHVFLIRLQGSCEPGGSTLPRGVGKSPAGESSAYWPMLSNNIRVCKISSCHIAQSGVLRLSGAETRKLRRESSQTHPCVLAT